MQEYQVEHFTFQYWSFNLNKKSNSTLQLYIAVNKIICHENRAKKIKRKGPFNIFIYLRSDLELEKVLGKSRNANVGSRNAMGAKWLRVVISGSGFAAMPK